MSETRPSAKIYGYRLPFAQPMIFNDHQLSFRQGWLVEYNTAEGQTFWAEAAPLPGFSNEDANQTFSQLQVQIKQLLTGEMSGLPTGGTASLCPSVCLALSCLINELKPAFSINNKSYLLQGNLSQMLGQWQQLLSNKNILSDPLSIKMKVGRYQSNLEIDFINRLVQEQPSVQLCLDANQNWSFAQAINIAKQLPTNNITYIEEPFLSPTIEQLSRFYQLTGVSIALDESLQQTNYQFKPFEGLVMQVIKPTLIGSIERCQDLISQAAQEGVASYISSSFESDYGLALLNQLAIQLTPNQAPGLDTHHFFSDELINNKEPDKTKLTLLWQSE